MNFSLGSHNYKRMALTAALVFKEIVFDIGLFSLLYCFLMEGKSDENGRHAPLPIFFIRINQQFLGKKN